MKGCSCLKKLLIARPMLVVALFKLVGDFIQGIDGIGRHFTEQHAILVSLELGQKCDFVWTNLVGYGWWAGEIRPTENGDPASTPLTGTAGNKTESQNDVQMNASLFSMTCKTRKLQENR